MFPVITGGAGAERFDDGYGDVATEMMDSHTFDGGIQLVKYRPACSSAHRLTSPHDRGRPVRRQSGASERRASSRDDDAVRTRTSCSYAYRRGVLMPLTPMR